MSTAARRAAGLPCGGLGTWRLLFLAAVACCALALWHFAPRRLFGRGGGGGSGDNLTGQVGIPLLSTKTPAASRAPSAAPSPTAAAAAATVVPHEEPPGDEVAGAEEVPLVAIPVDFYGPSPSPRPARAKGDAPPRPTRDPTWVAEQRPRTDDGGAEHGVTSHLLEESTAHSMNPPPIAPDAWPGIDSAAKDELRRRLVVGIAMGVHSGRADVDGGGVGALRIINTLVTSLLPVLQTNYVYRCVGCTIAPPPLARSFTPLCPPCVSSHHRSLYFGFDHNDRVYESAEWRTRIEEEVARLVAEEDSKRWHPGDYQPYPSTIDDSRLLLSVHWVHCDFAGKPAWAHSDAGMAAFKEGADFVYRCNDDTAAPVTGDWMDRFILDLRNRSPAPLLGVVGPLCDVGATRILTHDVTHRTHAAIFGYIYPRSLPDWSSDDWISFVYDQFDRMSVRRDVPVKHLLEGQRYRESGQWERLPTLRAEIEKGKATIEAWVRDKYGSTVTLPWRAVDLSDRS